MARHCSGRRSSCTTSTLRLRTTAALRFCGTACGSVDAAHRAVCCTLLLSVVCRYDAAEPLFSAANRSAIFFLFELKFIPNLPNLSIFSVLITSEPNRFPFYTSSVGTIILILIITINCTVIFYFILIEASVDFAFRENTCSCFFVYVIHQLC